MVDERTRRQVRTLVKAVREHPTELPVSGIVDLSEQPARVSIELDGPEPLVFVTPRPDPRFDVLTNRQYEVATLVAAGFTNRQIADALAITEGTVKDHVHAILKKTDLESRAEVAACWYGQL